MPIPEVCRDPTDVTSSVCCFTVIIPVITCVMLVYILFYIETHNVLGMFAEYMTRYTVP